VPPLARQRTEEVAKVLRGEGYDTQVVNAKDEKIKSISEYDLIIWGRVCKRNVGRGKRRIS
jgi:uncharacterized protein with PIN domain